MKALFCSYFFPIVVKIGRLRVDARIFYWTYCFWLYWCTMYLMHHYLIDLVAGACLATFCFYFFLTDAMREAMEQHYPYRNSAAAPPSAAPPSNRPDQAFASTATAGEGSIALDTLRGAPYISGQGGVNGDVESQKRPEVIFSIDEAASDNGDIAGSSAEEERRRKDAAALLARTKSPVQRVRTPANIDKDTTS